MFSARASITGVSRLFEKLQSFYKNEAPKIAAGAIISDIKTKTLSGVDSQNESFKGYSNGYKKRRLKKGLQVDHVDLKDTGGLHDSIHYDPSANAITVDTKHELIAEGLNRTRKFLGDPGTDTASRVENNIASAIPRILS